MEKFTPKTHPLMLDHEREVASEIGILLSAFAIVELSPPAILAKLTGIDQTHAEIILGHFRSFSARLDVVEAIAKSQHADDPERAIAIKLLEKIRACGRIRNKYAHGIWQGVAPNDKTVELHVIGWAADAKKQTSRSVVTLETIIEDCSILREAVFDVTNYGNLGVPFP
jgi:hypothetical protein